MKLIVTSRGFERIDFADRNGDACSLQQSSLAGGEHIWLGRGDERMHLHRDQVAQLYDHLGAWLRRGSFTLGVLLVALAGCAVGPRSYDSTLPPVQHRAVRALVGATITLGADDVGIRPAIALAIGTVGQVVASKALMAVQHPDRLGPWTLGDVACDLTWSAAITPYLVGRHAARAGGARAAATAGGLTFAGWLAAAVLVARRCVP